MGDLDENKRYHASLMYLRVHQGTRGLRRFIPQHKNQRI